MAECFLHVRPAIWLHALELHALELHALELHALELYALELHAACMQQHSLPWLQRCAKSPPVTHGSLAL